MGSGRGLQRHSFSSGKLYTRVCLRGSHLQEVETTDGLSGSLRRISSTRKWIASLWDNPDRLHGGNSTCPKCNACFCWLALFFHHYGVAFCPGKALAGGNT